MLPEDPETLYAVGDVHGCLRQLRLVEDAILRDGSRTGGVKLIVMLGDYVDRGPESAGVIDHLMQPLPEGFLRVCLCGNHEDVFLRFLQGSIPIESWLEFGGGATLRSYGIDMHALASRGARDRDAVLDEINRTIPAAHRLFLESLPIMLATRSYLLVHAGVRPGVPLERQNDRDLMWIRDEFLKGRAFGERIVVYGHTPMPKPRVDERGIGIDTAACKGGSLTAVRCRGASIAFFQAS